MEKLPWGCAGEAPKGFLESNEDEVETERELDPDGNIVFKGDDINRGLPLDTNVGEEECRDDMASRYLSMLSNILLINKLKLLTIFAASTFR